MGVSWRGHDRVEPASGRGSAAGRGNWRLRAFPGQADLIRAFHVAGRNHGRTIDGSVAILRLRYRHRFGLTNWSHETFPLVRARYPFFQVVPRYRGLGEGLIKPDRRLYAQPGAIRSIRRARCSSMTTQSTSGGRGARPPRYPLPVAGAATRRLTGWRPLALMATERPPLRRCAGTAGPYPRALAPAGQGHCGRSRGRVPRLGGFIRRDPAKLAAEPVQARLRRRC
jgi:hypothetical protein